jgi:phosphoribosyl 1,2-cyclic phosphodiesterase
VWATQGTARAARLDQLPASQLKLFHAHEQFAIGALEVRPYAVPHDAREPSQFVFADGQNQLGLLTDVGEITPHIVEMLQDCDALMLEANHDEAMLENGPYPPALKRRVGGRLGHLSNRQSAELLQRLDCSRLQHLVAMHLSEKNNQPQLAQEALAAVLNCPANELDCADQDQGFDWRSLH